MLNSSQTVKRLPTLPKNGSFSLTDLPSNHTYNGIDLFKFIGAFLVVIIHVTPFVAKGPIPYAEQLNFLLQKYICRIAVPFYFAASGFLLFKKMDLDHVDIGRVKNYCFKILRLAGIWLLLLGSTNIIQLWYLSAVVVASVLLALLFKFHFRFRSIIVIAGILYAIGLLGDTYNWIIEPLNKIGFMKLYFAEYKAFFPTVTRNGVFMGFIFVLIGAMFAFKKIKMSLKFAYLGFALSMLFLLAEVLILRRHFNPREYSMSIFLVPAIFFLFYIASHVQLKDRDIYKRMRVVGMLIFYLHMFVRKVLKELFTIIKNHWHLDLFGLWCILTIVIVTLLAILVERLSYKEKFRWLRWIYS